MTLDFQREILKYLVQHKEGKFYIPLLDTSMFDMPEYSLVFELVSKYLKQYMIVPKKVNLMEFWDEVARDKKNKVTPEQRQVIERAIYTIYDEFNAETNQLREKIVEYAQYRKTKDVMETYSGKLKDGGLEVFRKVKQEMNKIVEIGNDDSALAEKNRGGFMLKDAGVHFDEQVEGIPTYLKGMNKLTAAKGFFSPQLVILMGGPKSFKTGLMLRMAVEWVREGRRVYYADCENGIKRIRNRAKQAMLDATYEELMSGELNELLNQVTHKFSLLGGDLVIDHYPAYKSCINDIDMNLQYLKDEHGWEPEIILLDYADLFKPNDPSIKEKRFMLQHVYFDIINLNNKWNTFAMSPTPVNKNAVSKPVIEMNDFSEDWGKAYNCHSSWALCRTKAEKAAGTARLVAVIQRDGDSYVEGAKVPQVLLHIDEKRMIVREITFEEATVLAEEAASKSEPENKRLTREDVQPRSRRRTVSDDNITDD